MEHLEKMNALEYIIKNNNLCTACNRANINEIKVGGAIRERGEKVVGIRKKPIKGG